MRFLRQFVSILPKPIKSLALELGNRVKQDVFGLPDAVSDFRKLSKILKPDMILDIGAHVGEFAASIRKTNPDIPLILFEPTPTSITALHKRFNGDNLVQILPLAVSDKVGKEQFFLNNNEQTNSLLDNDLTNQKDFEDSTKHCETISIDTTTLDVWWEAQEKRLDAIIFIKADIQGAELKMIEGGAVCLRKSVAAIYTEVSIAPCYVNQGDLFSVHQRLTDLGFILFQVYRTRSNSEGRALWADALWVKPFILEQLSKSK